jgi:hypothetical protein
MFDNTNMTPSTVLLTPIFLHLSACFSVDEFSDCSKVSLNTFPGLPLEEERRSRGDFVRKQRRDQHSGGFGINKLADILSIYRLCIAPPCILGYYRLLYASKSIRGPKNTSVNTAYAQNELGPEYCAAAAICSTGAD